MGGSTSCSGSSTVCSSRERKRPLKNLQSDEFWAKLEQRNTNGKWGEVLSTRSMDQKHKSLTKSRDRTKSIWAIFSVNFSKLVWERKNFVEKWLIKGWKHDPNPWKPLLLIPNDVGLGPIFTDLRGEKWRNTKNTRGKRWRFVGKTQRITSKTCKDLHPTTTLKREAFGSKNQSQSYSC